MNAAGPLCARTTRSILVVLEGELELPQRDRPSGFGPPLVQPVLGAGLRLRPVGDMLLAAPALVAHTGAPRLGVAMEIAAPRLVVSPFVGSPRLCHTSLLVGRAVRPSSL